MTLTFNTHTPSLTQLVVDASTKFRWKNDPAKVKQIYIRPKKWSGQNNVRPKSGPAMAGPAVTPTTALQARLSITEMLTQLGWRSLEQRRNDSRLCLFYKIIYGLVAIDLPPYVEHPARTSLKNSHPLVYRQIHTGADYKKYSFYPLAIVQWNRLPSKIALLPTFEHFKRAVCTISHPMP